MSAVDSSAPPVQRPPLGLIPRSIHNQKRAQEIVDAMARYIEASKKIPHAWLRELTEIYAEGTEV